MYEDEEEEEVCEDECEHPNAVLSDDDEPATYYCPDCGETFIGDEEDEEC